MTSHGWVDRWLENVAVLTALRRPSRFGTFYTYCLFISHFTVLLWEFLSLVLWLEQTELSVPRTNIILVHEKFVLDLWYIAAVQKRWRRVLNFSTFWSVKTFRVGIVQVSDWIFQSGLWDLTFNVLLMTEWGPSASSERVKRGESTTVKIQRALVGTAFNECERWRAGGAVGAPGTARVVFNVAHVCLIIVVGTAVSITPRWAAYNWPPLLCRRLLPRLFYRSACNAEAV